MKEDICEELIRLQPYIINKAKHYIVNEADLDDFVQEGMITLYRKIPQYNPSKILLIYSMSIINFILRFRAY